jgi:methylmalonyl-CoA mutase, N-terminal domain
MKNRFHAKNAKSWHLRFHVQTSGESLTAQQVDNNVIRVTSQAMAAVLGGCQSLHTNSRDEALALPTEESVKIALRTQQVIAAETGIAKTVDPVGGSYYVEYLTSRIEEEVQKYLRKIDRMGGALVAIERGFFQEEIRRNAYNMKKEIDTKKRTIVGVNKFQDSDNVEPKLNLIDTEIESKQRAKLRILRDKRDRSKVEHSLSSLQKAAEQQDKNLMSFIVEAVRNKATLGEIADSLGEIYGTFEPKVTF